MQYFHFLQPHWLLLLPVAVALLWAIARRGDAQRKWRAFIAPHLLKALLVDRQHGKGIRPLTLLGVVLLLGIVALAGPSWRQQPSPFTQDAASLVIVLKVTPSMLTEDVQPSRLQRATQKIRDVLARRPGARTALIAYAGSSHLVMPLTRDASIINTFAADLGPGVMPREGDDPLAALSLATQQLRDSGQRGSVLWIGDALAAEESSRIAAQANRDSPSVVMLGALGLERDSAQHRELQQAASTIGARLQFIAPDERDVDAITDFVAADFSSMSGAEEGMQWRDEGYWILFPLVALSLLWFRAGWLVRYR